MNRVFTLAPFALLIPLFAKWFENMGLKALNHDVIWFMTSAERWLAGGNVVKDFYDPNPPLAFLIYVPAVLFAHVTGLSWESAIIVQTLAFTGLTALLLFQAMRKLTDNDNALYLSIVFIIAATIYSFADYGQRDQFIALALCPLFAYQLALSEKADAGRAGLWAAGILGGIMLWLQPLYGVIPLFLIGLRAFRQKRVNVYKDTDFIILAGVSVLYLAVLWFAFRDFMTVILPDFLRFYTHGEKENWALRQGAQFGLWCFAGIALLSLVKPEAAQKRVALGFFCAALACIAIYVIQLRDYSYQFIPAQFFMCLGGGQLLFLGFRRFLPAARYLPCAAIALGGLLLFPLSSYPTREAMRVLPLTQAVRDCGENCGMAGLGIRVRAAQLVPYYAGKAHASRFSDLWFLPQLQKSKGKEGYEEAFGRYASYLAEDLGNYAGSVLLVCDPAIIRYFEDSEVFAATWALYKRVDEPLFSYMPFYPPERANEFPYLLCSLYQKRA